MIHRRDLLRRLPPAAAGLFATGRRPAPAAVAPGAATTTTTTTTTSTTTTTAAASTPDEDDDSQGVFVHGVASGDPTEDAVVLWTRISGTQGDDPVAVRWLVAKDPELAQVVARGEASARPDADWTVHVDVGSLRPATTWWYRFEALGQRSPIGRTRSAPGADDGQELRLGVTSCASYAAGFFNVYRLLAQRDLDLVVHLGDYIYEADAGQAVRQHAPPSEPVSLADYRLRHAQYKTDPDLQALHQRLPVAAVWDDHEVAGNAWEDGASGHDPRTQGPWDQRRAAALQAYLEWMPLRRPDPDAAERIWRTLPLGASGELILIDTRHDERDRQVGPHLADPAAALADPDRRIMSEDQEAWLAERLHTATGAWRVIANQVVLSPIRVEVPEPLAGLANRLGQVVAGVIMNPDQWDGYPAARRRLLDVVADPSVGPVAVLTGDLHSSWAFDVPAGGEIGAPPVAVEMVVPSVTSETFAAIVGPDSDLLARGLSGLAEDQLAHARWTEIRHHGYLVASVTPERLHADWWHVDAVDGSSPGEYLAASWAAVPGEPRLQPAAELGPRARPAPPDPPPAPSAPEPALDVTDLHPLGVLGVAALAVGGALLALRRRRQNPE